MKPQLLPLIIISFFAICSCTKPFGGGGSDPANMNGLMSFEGKWQLVSDTISNSWLKTDAVNTNYIGVAGDYFDFRTDGHCYTKEGNVYDTLSYQWVSAQSIVVQKFGLNINGSIEPSLLSRTANTAVITTQNILSPGGTIFRKVSLTR